MNVLRSSGLAERWLSWGPNYLPENTENSASRSGEREEINEMFAALSK